MISFNRLPLLIILFVSPSDQSILSHAFISYPVYSSFSIYCSKISCCWISAVRFHFLSI